jgi:acyl transferase domain-containing protein/enoyl-CoA hydratase/carnithine racemase/NAD(P)-dependent dehydrogenase (short-subunit alcohol dehydrogenase family)/acyl carrier protein
MKRLLRKIYDDVVNGRLSQSEALEQVRTLKLQEQSTRTGTLLAAPVWEPDAVETLASASFDRSAERHLLLGELPHVDVQELASAFPLGNCQSLTPGPGRNLAQRYTGYAVECFERIQTILRGKPEGNVFVQIVMAGDGEQAVFAGLSGLLRTMTLENPQFRGQVMLVPADTPAADLARLLTAEQWHAQETVVRYEQGVRQVWRWQEVPRGAETSLTALKDDGVYLITGGLGGLGVLFAREILEQAAAARVVLTGRSTLTAEKQALLDELAAHGGRVSYRKLDLGNVDQVQQLIDGIRDEHERLDGILHCAGMTADNFLLRKTSAEFTEVLAPKVTGTFHLDHATRNVRLDFFVLFSSVAGAVGNLGQADYATANGFMDQFAAYRNRQVAAGQRHGRTRSIGWPLWEAGGMTPDPATRELMLRATGGSPIKTAAGIDAFYRSLALPYDQLLVAEGDLAQMRRTLALAHASVAPQAKQAVDSAAIGAEDLAGKTREYLRRQLSGLLKLPSHQIDPDAALEIYGINSILALKLTDHLEETFGALSKTLFFEYQTISELAGYFIQSHAPRLATLFATADDGGRPPKAAAARPVAPPPAPKQSPRRSTAPPPITTTEPERIAIIGLSGRYPEAVDIDAYWRNLRDGKDCITEVPKQRWEWQKYFSEDRTATGHHLSKWGGFIAGVDEFDALFFNISPKEAKSIDPQERLFLQHAWMAIEDAGYTRASLQIPSEQDLPGQVGVYVGVMYTEYQLLAAENRSDGRRMGVPGSMASVANRVSYALNLHGPSMTLDTMCSSSLTAIHLACQDLKLGRTSLAIAGGVNVSIHPNKYLVLSAGQFISSDGHCQSFGEGGDGYIPGEGVGAVVLKRLSEAKRDGDHIYGVIRGSALNHGGKTNGYSVPNPQAQGSAISRALTESHTNARHVSYIEAHGTGTKLGDPIEIAALNRAFQAHTQDTGFCLIGSAKSNIGHCESAAGIAGLTKVLLQMQYQQIVPSLHSEKLNPHIDFPASPFVVNQSLTPWEQPVLDGRKLPRIAGLSSFGAGGSNAHILIEEYQPPVLQATTFTQVAILLSARTADQLQQKAHTLLHFLRPRLTTIDLGALAFTLQSGREPMDERLAFVVSSVEQAAGKLQAWLAGEQDIEDVYQGQVKREKEALSLFSTDADLKQTIDKWLTGWKLARLLELWVKGLEVDWSRLYGETKPGRISLPAYPFAKDRHWIDADTGGNVPAKGLSTAVLHPLLHSNTSDLGEQRYSSTFTGNEPFLIEKTLPAMACLEMARAAIDQASPAPPERTVIELIGVQWGQPVVVGEKTRVSIALVTNDDDAIGFEIYSGDAGLEIIHCQGRGVSSREPAPAALDLEQLAREMDRGTIEPATVYAACVRAGLVYAPAQQGIRSIQQGNGQLLAYLRLANGAEDSSHDYFLHPLVMEGALQACAALLDGAVRPRLPFALESVRIVSPCTSEMVAWVRYSAGSGAANDVAALDVDLCDAKGNVCIALRGFGWQPASPAVVAQTVVHAAVPAVRREVVVVPSGQAAAVPAERKKPAGISLAPPTAHVPLAMPSAARAAMPLANTAIASTPAASAVKLYDDGNGIFSIQIAAAPPSDVAAQLRSALEKVQQDSSIKVLRITGIEGSFGYDEAVTQGLYEAIVAFPWPVIAVLQRDAIGAGFMFAALCDFMVCVEEARYGFTDAPRRLYPTTAVTALFSERFGHVRAQDLLYGSSSSTGEQLRAKGWTCPILPATQIEAYAQELASDLATKSRDALRLLKQHLTRHLTGLVPALVPLPIPATAPDPLAKPIVSHARHVQVDSSREHVLVLRLGAAGAKELLADLRELFGELGQSRYKAVVLVSEDRGFLPPVPDDQVAEFQRLFDESRIPVVAALEGNAEGNAWRVAQSCDACVYSGTGVYSPGDIAQPAIAIFSHRFGSEAAREILLTGADYRGAELGQRVGTLLVTERDRVVTAAMEVAELWATLPYETLTSWKEQSAKTIRDELRSLPLGREHAPETVEPSAAEPSPIVLQSHVVTATVHPGGIVVVKMEDRDAKNLFSEALIEGLTEAFGHVEQTPAYKVVILTGYDSYFASGGTKEGLLAIQAGKAKFTDTRVFQLALDCRLPVIAAMQGHGIGAGWSLGMFADVVLLSEESRYVSPYMGYGFTPGAGATWILADRMGEDLARESLLTARHLTGRELKHSGATLRILPRAEVAAAAMVLAQQIARHDRSRLIALKQQWTSPMRELLEETYRLEVAMHEQTFVGQADTLAQIQTRFHEESASAQPVQAAPAAPRSADSDALPAVTATLKLLLANELQMRESDVDEHAQFIDLGLDSISGVTWVRRINEKYQIAIEATKVYAYPTLAQLSRHVWEEAEKQGTLSMPVAVAVEPAAALQPFRDITYAHAPVAKPLTSRRGRRTSRPAASAPVPSGPQSIAVVGMAGQFPEAKTLEEFWSNLAEGKNCITRIPARRWDVDAYYQPGVPVPGKTNSQWLGALEEYDLFDPLFFNISPTEAENMDPQQRLFLQACWHSIENAGYDARVLSGSKCGVFVGCAAGDYHQLSERHQLSAHGFTGNAMSILAARISYFLNLQGPCVSIDTACSSSLVAIAQACDSLNSGSSDLALAGGVYVMAGPQMHIMTSQAAMLSPEGKCFTFDQRADGFVPGEGVGVVVLKRLADAERDRDIIHGVIQGWGVNQDGRTNGITAPNPDSQTRLEQDVYDKYGIDPASIQLVEAHGTGTKLGDPIEVDGLKASFKKYTRKTQYCALGSVKSNIGHCLTAAGIAGVIKLLLALKHKQLPPTINFERLNEHMDLTESPFFVNTRLQEWVPAGAAPRLSAISSFGFSGTNAHLVIGEHLPVAAAGVIAAAPPDTKTVILLSARTLDQLQQKARELRDFIGSERRAAELREIAYTLQVGRAAMDERLGFIVSSFEQLAEKLDAYLNGALNIEDVHQGGVKRNREALSLFGTDSDLQETIDKWLVNRKLSKLVDLWVKGLELDWSKLYGEVKPQRVGLPVYPFAKDRYWIEAAASEQHARISPAPINHRARLKGMASRRRNGGAPIPEPSRPLFFRESWKEQPSTIAAPQPERTKFILFADPEWHAALANSDVDGHFAGATIVQQAPDYRRASERELFCRFNDEGDLRQVLEAATAGANGQPVSVVYTWAQGRGLEGIHALFGLFKAVRASAHPIDHVILAGHYDPAIAETCWDYSWGGFERSLRQSLPNTRISVLYTDGRPCAAKQLRETAEEGGIVWYKDDRRMVLSIEPVQLARTSKDDVLRQGGTYLITGGGGALALQFARHLAENYGAKLLLLGRREQTPAIQAQLQTLVAAGARDARYVALDVSDKAALSAWAQQLTDPIAGIIHAAGVESEGAFFERTPAGIDAVLRAKTLGTLALTEVFGGHPLDFICHFSSTAAALGDHGAADYAIASRFQTAFGVHRPPTANGKGKTLVINWPFWQDGGMGFKDREQAARYLKMAAQEFGNEPLTTQAGLEIWRELLHTSEPQTMVMVGQPARVAKFLDKVYGSRPRVNAGSYRYANKTEEVYSLILPSVSSQMEYLTFCPFEARKPGFSMSATFLNPKKYAADRHLVHVQQTEMRQVLFCNEDFARLDSVLDFGCGHGTDVIQLGASFLNLQLDGFTITADQARLGSQRILARNLDARVKIHHKDSAKDPFPGKYDLIFGIEVCPHVEDKTGLFRNIRNSLTAGGTVLLMDVISARTSVDDRSIGLSVPTQEEWLDVISGFRFRIDQFIDVSPEIANFLYDPAVNEHVGNLPQAVRDTYKSYAGMSAALESGQASYVLVRLKADDEWSDEQIAVHNRDKVRDRTPYPAALEAMLKLPRVDYPAPVGAYAGDPAPPEVTPIPLLAKGAASHSEGASQERELESELRASLAEVLHLKASDVDVDQPFSELGLDSFLGTEWINAINAKYGSALPNIVVYDYPSIKALASFLEQELPAPARVPAVARGHESHMPSSQAISERTQTHRSRRTGRKHHAAPRSSALAPAADKVAIIGMSGRYPQAPNLREYWSNLVDGKNAIVEIPRHRWDVDRYYDPRVDAKDKTSSKWLGLLADVDCFDPLFFRIAPHDAVHMDPQHRLFLEESYKAFEDAGYSAAQLNNRKCGVYLGISTNEYALRLMQNGIVSAPVTSNSFAIAAARIAYYLNLKGPALSIDTACSSSLVALHLASQALLNGETDLALAGGVNLWLAPESYISMSQAGMLSPTGQCRSFDDAADGIVVGEGVGALVLKRLKDAERDNDFIYGVILGSGINQDGRTNGITAPSVQSQTELIRDVYSRYAIDPESISYVETHGTGTKLGDPIELTALATVFKEKTAKKNYCALASVKSNIGHTAAAAGVASVHKVLLSMQHRALVPSLNVTKENAHFNFGDSPFYISRETKGWDVAPGSLRRAGVSSFGFSGTNAHLVIEEYVPAAVPAIPSGGDAIFMIPLSARSEEQLQQKARDLLEHLASSQAIDLAGMAYTLQVGRDAMEERLGFLVSSVEELAEKLSAYLDGGKNLAHVYRGGVEARSENMTIISRDDDIQEAIGRWIARRKLPKLLDLWTKGLELDWQQLYGDATPRRVSLPTYPFAREHYWVDEAPPVSPGLDRKFELVENIRSIEEVIDRIGDDAIDSDEAVRLLRVLV